MATFQVIINHEVYQFIPYGFCACGCGKKTTVSPSFKRDQDYIKGSFRKYVQGHNVYFMPRRLGANNHNWKGGRQINSWGYVLIYYPGHHRADHHGYVFEHILVAEKALGKPLPPKAVVHHINGITTDNSCHNLVVCQDTAYHTLIHIRERALKNCGNSHWRKCCYCKQWDSPDSMVSRNNRPPFHSSCRNIYHTEWRLKRLR